MTFNGEDDQADRDGLESHSMDDESEESKGEVVVEEEEEQTDERWKEELLEIAAARKR